MLPESSNCFIILPNVIYLHKLLQRQGKKQDYHNLSELNGEIISNNVKIRIKEAEIANTNPNDPTLYIRNRELHNLKVYQDKLYRKRNNEGTKAKLHVMKSANHFVLARGFSHSKFLKGFSSQESFVNEYSQTISDSYHRTHRP